MKNIILSNKFLFSILFVILSVFHPQVKAAAVIGLAKTAEITASADNGKVTITQTYNIKNYGTSAADNIRQIELIDPIAENFSAKGTLSNFVVTVVSTDNTSVKAKNGYDGKSTTSLLANNCELLAGQSAVIQLTYDVVMLETWDGSSISFAANSRGVNASGSLVQDLSSNGTNPDFNNNGNPNDDASPTPININLIYIDSTTPISIPENPSSIRNFTVRRVGTVGTSTVTLTFAPSGTNPATLGTAAGPFIDAWVNQLTQTLTFTPGQTQKTISLHVDDDNMLEPNETLTVTLSNQSKDVSLLQSKKKIDVTITSDETEDPTVNIALNGSSYISEKQQYVTLDVTLAYPTYKTATIDWKVTGQAANCFTGIVSGTVTFLPGETHKTITLELRSDLSLTGDLDCKIHLSGPKNCKMPNNSNIDLTIYTPKITWLKAAATNLHAGSGIEDTDELHFKVSHGALDNAKVQITLPAGITYTGFENIIDNNKTFGVKDPVINGNTITFTVDKSRLELDQLVHFKIKRKAECGATPGINTDIVRVPADGFPGGVKEATSNEKGGDPPKILTYTVFKGILTMNWVQGGTLTFDKTQKNTTQPQAVAVKNTGDGWIGSFTVTIRINTGIGAIENVIFRSLPGHPLSLTGPVSSGGYDTYQITVTGTDLALIGNKNNVLDKNDGEIVIQFQYRSPSVMVCPPTTETLSASWACQNPAATLSGYLSIFEEKGKPILVRTLSSPVQIYENGVKGTAVSGTPNLFVMTLENTGKADAYYIEVPFAVHGENEWFNTDEVTVTVTGGTTEYDPIAALQNARSLTITNLVIPEGEKATITYPVRRHPLERYTAATADMLAGGYFCYVESGKITYTDVCRQPAKAGSIGNAYFNTYRNDGTALAGSPPNLSYMPELMTTDVARIDILNSQTKTLSFELGNLTTVFSMYDKQNWFGGNGGGTDSKVIITFHSTPNVLLDAARIINSTGSAPLSLPITNSGGDVYAIEIPYNTVTEAYFSKNSKVEFTIKGDCSTLPSSKNNIFYTVDFVTNRGVTHKFYKKTYPEVYIKCQIDAGVNLQSLTVKRINYGKGDSNDDGIDANEAVNTATIKLDRFYHNDILEIEYKIKVGLNVTNYNADCTPAPPGIQWEYLYATMGNMDSARFKHSETIYELYHQNDPVAYAAGTLPVKYANAAEDSAYVEIDRSASPFTVNDEITIRSRWVVKTITGEQWEKSYQLNFWTHCEMDALTPDQVYTPRISTNSCDPQAQNYEKESASVQLFSLWHDTDGPQAHRYVFTDYDYQDIVFDYKLSVGVAGYDNTDFINELRQPYYADSMSYTIPYGYELVPSTSAALPGSVYFFGNSDPADRMYYGRNYNYPYPVPELQGTQKKLGLESRWHLPVTNNYNPASGLGQVADEGWDARPYFTLRPTPRSEPGEKIVYVRIPYKSPSALPGMVNTQAGFILYDDAPKFIISTDSPVANAYNDTVMWPIRITNTSSLMPAANGWIYIDSIDMKGVKLIDIQTNTVTDPANEGRGYQGRWLYVGDIPANGFRDFYLVTRYNKMYCDNDTLNVAGWYDYAAAGDDPMRITPPSQPYNYTNNPLVYYAPSYPNFDGHTSNFIHLYVNNMPSRISGYVTPLEDTPVRPDNPTGALYGSNEIERLKSFPVEIGISSEDIIGVKDVRITLNIPAGLRYINDSAYYEWKGMVQKVAPAAEDSMRAINRWTIVKATDAAVTIKLEQFTGHAADTLKGTYDSQPSDREFILRFKLVPECTGLKADSIIISATLEGNRLCGAPAEGNGMTVVGKQIDLNDFRNYQMLNDISAPDGAVFAECAGVRTLRAEFTRLGAGELHDKYELRMPAYLDVNGADPVRYLTPTVNPADDPITINNVVVGGRRYITWDLPKTYSQQTDDNITVQYAIDVRLASNSLDIPENDTILANIRIGNLNNCANEPDILAADTLYVSAYTSLSGVAKDVSQGALTVDNYYPVTYTYTVENFASSALERIQLQDDLSGMFGDMIEMKDFQIAATYAVGDTLAVDDNYRGSGNIISSGSLSGKATATVTVSFLAKPTTKYDGQKFKNNAYIKAYNAADCAVSDSSCWGVDPDFSLGPDNVGTTDIELPDATFNNDNNPKNNDTKTPIIFSCVRFRQNPPQYLLNENYLLDDPSVDRPRVDKWLDIVIERVGIMTPYTVELDFKTDPVFLSLNAEATLGMSNIPCVDAYPAPLTQTVSFAQDDTIAVIRIEIVDDNIYEPTEAFMARIHSVSNPTVAVVNDTASIIIKDNDQIPTVNLIALNDSLKEDTKILPGPAYGCTPMKFVAALSNPTYETVSLNWAISGGTAVAGVDYTALPAQAISFTNSCAVWTDTITICVIADSVPESAVRLESELTITSLGTVVAGNMTAGTTIVDDDVKIRLLAVKHLICKSDRTGMIAVKARGGETRASGGKYHYRWTGPNGFTAHHYTADNDTVKNLQAGIYTVTVTDVWSNPSSATLTVEILEPANPLTVTIDDVKNVTCFGTQDGHIHTTVTGGWDSPNYTIGWTKENDSFTAATDDIDNISGGVYHLSVSDSAGCTVNNRFEIDEPMPLVISDTVIHYITCKGYSDGMISVTLSGGKPFPPPNNPYFIFWSGPSINAGNNGSLNLSGLSPGTYTLTVTDNGCGNIHAPFVIRQPFADLTAALESTGGVPCKGDATGKATIDTDGGWGKYVYLWSDGVTITTPDRNDLTAGTYSVLVTDSGGCTKSVSPIVIDEPAERMEVKLTATDVTYQKADDGTVTVIVTGGVPAYTYSWADMPTADVDYRNRLKPGTYTVEVTDQRNCKMSESAVIKEPKIKDNLPTAFTPDGDGYNDRLLESYYIKVFSRWGLLLYEGADGWDGRYKGKMMPAGTYFYILIDEDTGEEYKSSVLLQITK